MKQQNPTLLLFPLERAKSFSNKYLFIGSFLSKIIFSLKYDLQKAEINIDPERYCLASLFSAAIYGLMFFFVGLAFGVVLTKGLASTTVLLALAAGIISFGAAIIFHLFYPKIASTQLASAVDQELVFALRSMLIQLSSGISLFSSLNSIANSDYGQVSIELKEVINGINSGLSETKALEKLAFKTKSEVLKKTVWQMITTLKSGGSLVTALSSQVQDLVDQQGDSIKKYSAELNLWTLVYLIVAAAMPSLGVTFLVIASSISSAAIGKETVILIAVLAVFVQLALIMVIRTQVPKVIK